jgi:hypothetical protein
MAHMGTLYTRALHFRNINNQLLLPLCCLLRSGNYFDYCRASVHYCVLHWTTADCNTDGLAPLKLLGTGSLASYIAMQYIYGASSLINSNVYISADNVACIQLWSLHEQCHQGDQLRGNLRGPRNRVGGCSSALPASSSMACY